MMRWSRPFVPQWGVLENDAIACLAPSPSRDVGPDLCRGLILPADRALYHKVDGLEACTEMLALLSMVSSFPYYTFVYSFGYLDICLGLISSCSLGCHRNLPDEGDASQV